MPQVLTEAQIGLFREQGYLTRLPVIGDAEAAECRRRIETYETETGKTATETLHIKGHLYFTWLWQLSQHPNLTGAIADLIGQDLFVLASRFWIKEPGDRKFVTWHQDLAYFGLDPQIMVTAWLALTPVTRANGCQRFIPRSHRALQKHTETYDPDNLLSRGQQVADVDESTAVDILLRPGEMSIHHGNLLHSSQPNVSDGRRVGFALMMFPAHVRSALGRRPATLIRGKDTYSHWDHDPLPRFDRDPVIWQLMAEADRAYRDKDVKQEAEVSG